MHDSILRACLRRPSYAWLTIILIASVGCSGDSDTAPSQPQSSKNHTDSQQATGDAAQAKNGEESANQVRAEQPQSGRAFVVPQPPPLTPQETALRKDVAQLGGWLRKNIHTNNEVFAGEECDLTVENYISVGFDRMAARGKLAKLADLERIIDLNLSRSDIVDQDVAELRRAKNLVALDLNYTDITDTSLEHLMALPNLRIVVLRNTKITLGGLEKLRAANPRLRIYHSAIDTPEF